MVVTLLLVAKDSTYFTITMHKEQRATHYKDTIPGDPNNEKNLVPDPLIKDDQATVVNVSGKGLVILIGCGHAGVVNTINYAKKITGMSRLCYCRKLFSLPLDGGI